MINYYQIGENVNLWPTTCGVRSIKPAQDPSRSTNIACWVSINSQSATRKQNSILNVQCIKNEHVKLCTYLHCMRQNKRQEHQPAYSIERTTDETHRVRLFFEQNRCSNTMLARCADTLKQAVDKTRKRIRRNCILIKSACCEETQNERTRA